MAGGGSECSVLRSDNPFEHIATLQDEIEKSGNSVGGKSLEIKSSIKKIMTSSDGESSLHVHSITSWGL